MKFRSFDRNGFTLIELLVVISVVTLLTSIVMTSLTTSRARAQDTAKKAELNSIKTAITSYKIDHDGLAPIPIGGSYQSMYSESGFNQVMQRLVDGGYLPKLPSSTGLFFYAEQISGAEDAVVIGSTLQTGTQSTTGDPGTCRPFSNTPVEAPHMVGSMGPPVVAGYQFSYTYGSGGYTANGSCRQFRIWTYQIINSTYFFSPYGTSYQACDDGSSRAMSVSHIWAPEPVGTGGYALEYVANHTLTIVGNVTSYLDNATAFTQNADLTNTTFDAALDHYSCTLGASGYKQCSACLTSQYGGACTNAVSYPTLCNNHMSDDVDGLVDLNDPGCASANDDGETPDVATGSAYCSSASSKDYCLCI